MTTFMEAYQWILDYWELTFLVVIPFGWKLIMGFKRKILDEVYATKAELRCAIDKVEKKVTKTITEHAKEDAEFQLMLVTRLDKNQEKVDANHNEIKDLIIAHLGSRGDAK